MIQHFEDTKSCLGNKILIKDQRNNDHLSANEAFVIPTIHNGADEKLMKIEAEKGHTNATCSKDGINNRST